METEERRRISILGDSISTYEGFNPPGYSVYYDEEIRYLNGLENVEDTWWMRVIHGLDGMLCINDSYSGSLVSGTVFPSAVCEERLTSLCGPAAGPDIILIYMGVNDFGYGVRVSRGRAVLLFSQDRKDFSFFEDAYDGMLKRLRELYPQARIVCGTLMGTAVKYSFGWGFSQSIGQTELSEYNDAIRKAAQRNGCLLADLAESGLRYETLDGLHPTVTGHETIAEAWIGCLESLHLI